MKDTTEGALLAAFLCLVETLDKRKVLSVADVATSIGDTIDFRKKQKDAQIDGNENLQRIYDHLLQLENYRVQIEALKARPPSGPPASASEP